MTLGFTGTLAYDYDSELVVYGKVCMQCKHDGCRVQIVKPREAANAIDKRKDRTVTTSTCTRSGGYVPNDYIRCLLDRLPVGLDGELMAADSDSASGEAQFSTSMSAITAKAGEPEFKYVVYDYSGNTPEVSAFSYADRMDLAWWDCVSYFGELQAVPEWLHFAPLYVQPKDKAELDEEAARLVALGHEGAIVRRLDLPHVNGRSSRKVPAVLRIKAFSQAEFEIVDVIEEVYHDCTRNRKECPELIGTGKGFSSSFVCAPAHGFTESFRAPLSVTDAVAKEYLANKAELIGAICTVRWLAQGNVNRPRLPVCIGLRHSFDIQ